MASNKEKETLLNVIELYRDMPYLWQKNHKDYMNKEIRLEGFRVLLQVYKNFDENANLSMLKKKLLNMRTNYTKELIKVNSSKKTGSGADEVYTPSLWYFDAFNFLESRSEPCRNTLDTLENENVFSSDEDVSSLHSESVASELQNCEPNRYVKKKRKQTLLQKQHKILKSAEKLLSSKEEEAWEIFGKSIGLQIKDLNKRQLTISQKLISDVIFYAKIDRLSEDSYIYVTPSNELSFTANRQNYRFSSIQQSSPASNCPSPSLYAQSPHYSSPSPHDHPLVIQQNHPLPLQNKHSSSHNYRSPVHISLPSTYVKEMSQPPQPHPQPSEHSNQSTESYIQVQSPYSSQSTQHAIQSPHQQLPSSSDVITVNNADEFLNYIDNTQSTENVSVLTEGPINVMKNYLVFKKKK